MGVNEFMNTVTIALDRQPKDTYGSEYDKHLFEQYKLYVEMADRISARRMLANTFFVGVHTALITAFSVLLKEGILTFSLIGIMPFIAVVILCYVWWKIIHSYRQLNSGKFKIIHALEERLPVAPYDAEWILLGAGLNKEKYSPLTHIENLVPLCFGFLYILLCVALTFQPKLRTTENAVVAQIKCEATPVTVKAETTPTKTKPPSTKVETEATPPKKIKNDNSRIENPSHSK